jgi:NADH dehydrogenase/NADH:ubiquinone oxidoreductase subunit G
MLQNIVINEKSFFINLTNYPLLIIICQLIWLDIPRFCYHDTLVIAGNCRMCLIDDNKNVKPAIACAIVVTDNDQFYTTTLKVTKAREGILEFLLINHPLDCPICDQGGECDLQDLSLIFGGDRGRFHEYKRAVINKNLTPFIKTLMNRCIHCTRCVRFALEYMELDNLGITGRGVTMEINTYIVNFLKSPLSGNIVDLCPVGAPTSRNYSFTARS